MVEIIKPCPENWIDCQLLQVQQPFTMNMKDILQAKMAEADISEILLLTFLRLKKTECFASFTQKLFICVQSEQYKRCLLSALEKLLSLSMDLNARCVFTEMATKPTASE